MLQTSKGMAGVFVAGALLGGCAANSGDRVGEQVHVRMLRAVDIDEYAVSAALDENGNPKPGVTERESFAFLSALHGDDDLATDKVKGEVDPDGNAAIEFTNTIAKLKASGWYTLTSDQSPLLAAAVPILAGLAVDALVAFLNEQAQNFEAQWQGVSIVDGYWSRPTTAATNWNPRFVGVEFIRSTKKFPLKDGGASRLVLLLLPSRSDDRLFVVHPLFYGNRSAKPYVAKQGSSLSASVDFAMHTTWVGGDNKAVQAQVASASFAITGYGVGAAKPEAITWRDPGTDAVGWFAAGPVGTPKKDALTSGVFRVVGSITETDESDTRQWIERASKFLSDQRGAVVERASGVAGGNP